MTMLIRYGDLTVVGGGLAGVCAAIAAARQGLTVNLINNRPVLGGNSSSEIRVWTRGATGGGNRYAEEMGILGEMKLENLYKNPVGNPYLWDQTILDFVMREENICLYLNTHIDQVGVEEEQITHIKGAQIGSEKHFTFQSEFYVDATGDGTVGFLAGAEYRTGREGKKEFGEEFAPRQPDNYSQGSSILFYTKRMNRPVPYVAPDFAYSQDHIRQLIQKGKRIVHPDMQGCDYWWFEYGGELDTIEANEEIATELRRLVYGIWDYIKNSREFSDVDDLTLEWVGSVPGKRCSRRFVGDYILTQNDIARQTKFHDAVCVGGWYLDFHPPEGIYSEEDPCEQLPVNVYEIPLRCLYSRNVKNLFLAGRDISTTYAAFASTRVMNTCAGMGQAVGTAAFVCNMRNKIPSNLAMEDIKLIQQLLIRNDQHIPGISNKSMDYALGSEVLVSSIRPFRNDVSSYKVAMDRTLFMVLPMENKLKELSLMLDCLEDTELSLKVYVSDRPENYQADRLLQTYHQRVESAERQWVSLDLNLEVGQGKIIIELQNNPALSIHCSDQGLTGVFLTDKLLGHTHFDPCFRATLQQEIYGGNNLVNGFHRPHGKANVWISDVRSRDPEWVTLDFKKEREIREVHLFFNPDLSKELTNLRPEKWAESHLIDPQLTLAPQLVKDYRVSVWKDDTWQLVKEVISNFQRRNVVRFEPQMTSKVKIEFLETHGSDFVEVFEVRVY